MPGAEPPKASERLLWVVLGTLAWKYAVLGSTLGAARESTLALAMAVIGSALGLACLLVGLSADAAKWLRSWGVFGLFTAYVVVYATCETVRRGMIPYTFSTDAHTFMDYSARLLLAGKNPYDTSLYGAMVLHSVPIDLQTPLMDGGFSDRLAYPSLSFVALVPFVAAGIPTILAYGFALYACFALLFRAAPRELRPLVLLPFFADDTYLTYAFGGLTDSVWALLLCLAVVYWEKTVVAAILFGLACAYKQHPWLLGPFLVLRVWKEAADGTKIKSAARFAGIAILAFAVVQLPFVVWNPRAWLQGIVEPLVTNMVPLGEGVSKFVAIGGDAVPKSVFSYAFWGTYAIMLVVVARWSAGSALVWIAPSVAFFLNWRSFSSYWIYNALPFVLELALRPLPEARFGLRLPVKRSVLVGIAGAAVALAVVVVHFYAKQNESELEVRRVGPVRTWGTNAHRMDLEVTNKSRSFVEPRFWVQGTSFQPIPWRIDIGPKEIAPGATATYSIAAVQRITEFDPQHGATLTVADLRSPRRHRMTIEPDPGAFSPRRVPNGAFDFWDMSIGAPTYWSVVRDHSAGGRAAPLFGEHPGVELVLDPDRERASKAVFQLCPALPACWSGPASLGLEATADTAEGDHAVSLETEFAAHAGIVSVWANTPADANHQPELATRYGVRLFWGWRSVFLLLGGEPGSGTLKDGTPWESIPGPREAWQRYELDLGALQSRYAKEVYPHAHALLVRFPLLDIPTVPMRFALTYASQSPGPTRVVFGRLDEGKPTQHDPIPDVERELLAHPGQIDAWRAAYEADLGNPERAYKYTLRARAREAHPAIDLQAAQIETTLGRYDDARASYMRALENEPLHARIGLGWLALGDKKPAEARTYFNAVLDIVAAREKTMPLTGEDELVRLIARIGVATAYASTGECAEADKVLSLLSDTEREAKVRSIPELTACAQKK